MELRHLQYFCAVADELSFTFAAQKLHVSQSGVSGQIRALEEELGARLLQRNKRKVALTPEGAAFLVEAREILKHADLARELFARRTQGRYGRIAVGLCGPATAPFLPRMIREYRGREPGVTAVLKDFDPSAQPAALDNREIDIGFTRSIPPELRHQLASEILYRESIIAVLPAGHPLQNQESVSLSELARERFVLHARECAPELFDAIVARCKLARFSPRIVDSPRLWHTVLAMVEAAEGVSLVPASVHRLQSQGVVFKPLRGRPFQVEVVVAWRQNEPDAIRDGFLNLLRKQRPELVRTLSKFPARAINSH